MYKHNFAMFRDMFCLICKYLLLFLKLFKEFYKKAITPFIFIKESFKKNKYEIFHQPF